ncbi:Uncharacterized protein SCG7086_CQ_00020 [Chlamydiales bacterium SCGC AG-110-P3]|nr:Uncharacterized protein SCG7086_CQ_00020 [Chlamydiales bacterium SCGC AG-110-P3]
MCGALSSLRNFLTLFVGFASNRIRIHRLRFLWQIIKSSGITYLITREIQHTQNIELMDLMKTGSYTLIGRLFLLFTATLAPFSTHSLVAQESVTEGSGTEEQGIAINFTNVGIIEYIRFISRATGRNFIFDERDLQFTVTIVSEEPTTIDHIMTALLQVLRINGLAMIEQGNNFLIHQNAGITPMGRFTTDESEVAQAEQEQTEIVTRLFQLKNIKATTVLPVLQPLISPQASMEVIPDSDHIVVTDYVENVKKMTELINSLDSPSTRLEVAQYAGRRVSVDDLILLAERIMVPLAQDETFILVPRPETNTIYIVSTDRIVRKALTVLQVLDSGSTQTGLFENEDAPTDLTSTTTTSDGRTITTTQDGRTVTTTPDGRTVTTTPDGKTVIQGDLSADPSADKADGAKDRTVSIGVIDIGSPEDRTGFGDTEQLQFQKELALLNVSAIEFGVYKLQYRKGDQMQSALSQLAEELITADGDPALGSAIRSIQWIENTNSLVFSGTPGVIRRIRSLIGELDFPLRQVLIEMLILDTTVDNSLRFGVELGGRSQNPSASHTFTGFLPSNTSSPLPGALNAVTLAGNPVMNTVENGQGFNLGVIGKVLTHNGSGFQSLGALITALNSDVETNIIMNPKIITEDNVPAEIFVGQNTRFRGQSITNDEGSVITTNFEFRDVGTRLKVTPFLGEADVITLEIEQEISRADEESAGDGATEVGPVTQKSNTTTRVHVPNNYFLIISGMITEQKTQFRERVPCLGGLPFAGAPFKSDSTIRLKRNIMIFIRPTIVSTADEIEYETKRQQDQWRDATQNPDPFKYEIDMGLEFLNLKVPR